MAGLSLQCGDCKIQLRTVEEAQEHAEVTGHTNFQESTEPVLNLVCATCGKPCRTQTEKDLHIKRSGHTEFSDKTLESARPIVLEPSRDAGSTSASGSHGASEETPEMVPPEVNKAVLEELEGMGFPTAQATRALHFSGADNVEGAVTWIVDHEDDEDIDEMPLVPAAKGGAVASLLTPEEAKARAQELVERARKKKAEEEKQAEREREKDRIRYGKELQEARRIEEDNERQRTLMYRKAEKEEEKRARDKIRVKLEEDKAERRRKLGLPPETPSTSSPQAPVEEKKNYVSIRPATKADQMRHVLRSIKQTHKDEDEKVKKAFQTLLTYIGNVANSPDEEKFRKIRLTNPAFKERVGNLGGVKFLELCGFETNEAGDFLIIPRSNVDPALLRAAGSELNSALINPFFGVL